MILFRVGQQSCCCERLVLLRQLGCVWKIGGHAFEDAWVPRSEASCRLTVSRCGALFVTTKRLVATGYEDLMGQPGEGRSRGRKRWNPFSAVD